jgi:hypothetical protein
LVVAFQTGHAATSWHASSANNGALLNGTKGQALDEALTQPITVPFALVISTSKPA